MDAALDHIFTVFVVIVLLTFLALVLWHAWRAWLRRRDERQWSEGYYSGVLAGRNQALGKPEYQDHPFSGAVHFYNSLGENHEG